MGTEWLLDGRVFRIVRQVATNEFVAHDLKFGVERVFTETEILSRFANHELSFAAAGDEAHPRTDKPISLPPNELSPHDAEPLNGAGRQLSR